jgi:hypothetical protein
MIRHGRRFSLLPCILLLGAVCDAATFEVDGRQVRVQSARFAAVIDGLAITRIENKLTGEVYAEPPAEAAAPSPALAALVGEQGVAVESLRPAVATIRRQFLGHEFPFFFRRPRSRGTPGNSPRPRPST